ncbi:ATP-binding protein [Roseateles puraquae]|uniref:histidine kinase n=1 Tax=Roseateles puraquae TaxID=431059 RepID=A0A254NCC6_9BURK|nr:ATP-binding protein [Roseateles puraquae]MDG0852590.1 HAMP domain-containing histidine kinase [Roseateles puraquae]OWR05304.1 histidine kinase [Roseateles puraquae]
MNAITSPAPVTEAVAVAPERRAGRANLRQLIELRWLAVGGQLATVVVVHHGLGIQLPWAEMLSLLGILAAFNLFSHWRAQLSQPVSQIELCVGLLVDVGVLTGQLYLAGGSDNPFIYLYLLQVAVASVLLRPVYLLAVICCAVSGFVLLMQWHRPLLLDPSSPTTLSPNYLGGVLLCFLLNVGLVSVFIVRINRNLRQRDAELAALRQRAAEEVHIVRMGLLASGAAHELGTPLATLSVILGDWAHMAPFAAEPELREEIEEMQRQIMRCKAIVTGILMSAGEMRGEAPGLTHLGAFVERLAADWRRSHPQVELALHANGLPALEIISDTALQQVIGNLLDNAAEAAPGLPLVLQAQCPDEDTLELAVLDRGPGFSDEMLAHFGEPYQSSKGQPGRGMGLFLSVNVARTLGGRLQAANRADGGAAVALTLPLASLLPRQSRPDAQHR